MNHLLHPEADEEFAGTVRYYSEVSPELGVRFYREMERLLREVCADPERRRRLAGMRVPRILEMLVGLLLQPSYIFGLLETIATLAVIVIYCLANLALTSYIRREHPDSFSIWHHLVSPWIATLALLPVLFVTVYPIPEWPYNIVPFFFVAALLVGFGYMLWREARHPGALLKGATMLVGSRSTAEGDVDWDQPA